jgi:hypothetical protein
MPPNLARCSGPGIHANGGRFTAERDPNAAAFKLLESRIRAQPVAETERPPQDYRAACTVLSNVYLLADMRSAMDALAGAVDLARVDECATCARAHDHAYGLYRRIWDLPQLRQQRSAARHLRRWLEAHLLMADDPLSLFKDGLDLLYGGDSDEELVYDLSLLVQTYRKLGKLNEDTERELAEAERLIACLRDPTGYESERERALAEATRVAHQTYALLCSSYDEVRKAIYLLTGSVREVNRLAPYLKGCTRRLAVPSAARTVCGG